MTFTPPPPNLFALQDANQTQGASGLGIYVASLDSSGDVTDDLQDQIDGVSESGGGTLIIPRGFYTIEGSIVIRKGVRLKGVIDATLSWDTRDHNGDIPGTVIHATGHENEPDASPLFTLEAGSSISSMSVYYPNQVRDRQDYKRYPWTIYISGSHCTVENITLFNSYLGIRSGKIEAPTPTTLIECDSGGHRIRNVFGTVLSIGIWVDLCTDVGRIENIHFHPIFWGCMNGWNETNYQIVQDIMQCNLTAFKLGWSDWESISDTFVWCTKIAYHFVQSVRNPLWERREMNGELLGVSFDKACTGFKVDYLQPMGIVVTNGQFVANGSYYLLTTSPRTAIEISDTCTGNVRFTNCNFWGNVKKSVVSNSRSFLSLYNCYFRNEATQEPIEPVVKVVKGRAQIAGCSFETSSLRTHLKLDRTVESAIVTGNNAMNTDSGSGFRYSSDMVSGLIIDNNET